MNTSYYIIAGILAGVLGLAVFLTIHHFTIKPIWFILAAGLLLSGAGGAAVGWSLQATIYKSFDPRRYTK